MACSALRIRWFDLNIFWQRVIYKKRDYIICILILEHYVCIEHLWVFHKLKILWICIHQFIINLIIINFFFMHTMQCAHYFTHFDITLYVILKVCAKLILCRFDFTWLPCRRYMFIVGLIHWCALETQLLLHLLQHERSINWVHEVVKYTVGRIYLTPAIVFVFWKLSDAALLGLCGYAIGYQK